MHAPYYVLLHWHTSLTKADTFVSDIIYGSQVVVWLHLVLYWQRDHKSECHKSHKTQLANMKEQYYIHHIIGHMIFSCVYLVVSM